MVLSIQRNLYTGGRLLSRQPNVKLAIGSKQFLQVVNKQAHSWLMTAQCTCDKIHFLPMHGDFPDLLLK